MGERTRNSLKFFVFAEHDEARVPPENSFSFGNDTCTVNLEQNAFHSTEQD